MTRKLVSCCAATALGLAIGCTPSALTKPTTTARSADAAPDYPAKLADLDAKAAALSAKAGKATGDEKAKLDAKAKEATAKRETFVKKLDEWKTADAAKRPAKQGEVQTAYEDARKAAE